MSQCRPIWAYNSGEWVLKVTAAMTSTNRGNDDQGRQDRAQRATGAPPAMAVRGAAAKITKKATANTPRRPCRSC
jgi:hypothetical protein